MIEDVRRDDDLIRAGALNELLDARPYRARGADDRARWHLVQDLALSRRQSLLKACDRRRQQTGLAPPQPQNRLLGRGAQKAFSSTVAAAKTFDPTIT